MKLGQRKTELEKVMRVLDAIGAQYMRATVEAQDKVEKKTIETEVIMLGAVFEKKSGRYLFACPVSNPIPRNHNPL